MDAKPVLSKKEKVGRMKRAYRWLYLILAGAGMILTVYGGSVTGRLGEISASSLFQAAGALFMSVGTGFLGAYAALLERTYLEG